MLKQSYWLILILFFLLSETSCNSHYHIPRKHLWITSGDEATVLKEKRSIHPVSPDLINNEPEHSQEILFVSADTGTIGTDRTFPSHVGVLPVIFHLKSPENKLNTKPVEQTVGFQSLYIPVLNATGKDTILSEDNKRFNILGAISAALGVISWASIGTYIYYNMFTFVPWMDLLLPLGFFTGISAFILGIISLAVTRREQDEWNKRYLGILGLVMGGIEILLFLLVLVSLMFFIF